LAAFKVFITDFSEPGSSLEAEVFRTSGLEIELVRLQAAKPEEIFPAAADADALLVQWLKITPEVMERLPRCKVISRYGIGVDMVDLPAATRKSILVCNVPDYCIEEVSTHTLAFILALNRRLFPYNAFVHAGGWSGVPGGPPSRLSGQSLGLIGLGNIGSEVASKAGAIGFRLLGYDPYLSPARAQALGVELTELDDLLRRADFVSLHCPLTAETRGLIGAAQLALMKPSAYLINMARGPVVEQAALLQALASGVIRGAALDVLDPEPPAADDPLLQLDNVLITPHIASWTAEAVVQLRLDAARNVVSALRGELPRWIVNRKALGLP
jgi:D-3-phosphoglycerate dehydrogenase / 2-oxoglutarate reductase